VGLFFASPQPALPAATAEFRDALNFDAKSMTDADTDREAGLRAVRLSQKVTPKFRPWRVAIWTEQHNLHDISKTLMSCFPPLVSLIAGLIAGEAQRSS
jgi:hypothetical protein